MFRVISLLVIALLVVAGVWLGRPDHDRLAGELIRTTLEPVIADVVERAENKPVRIALDAGDGIRARHPATRPALPIDEKAARQIAWVPVDTPADRVDHTLRVRLESSPHSATLRYSLDDAPERVRRFAWYAVLPPLLAIVTAILFRHVIVCLVLGILAGGVIAVWPTDHVRL